MNLSWLYVRLCLWPFMCLFAIVAYANQPLVIDLKGYLDQDRVSLAKDLLSKNRDTNLVVIELDSSGGDIEQVLSFAKDLYMFKHDTKGKVIVYIDGTAYGPAAILPFVADELYTSIFVSWGDIPFGNETVLPSNILRSQVVSLIDISHAKKKDLLFLAAAMTGKDVKKNNFEDSSKLNFEHVFGQPLVVNQQQLQDVWFVQGQMPVNEFRAKFHLTPLTAIEREPKANIDAININSNALPRLEKYADRLSRPFTVGHLIIEDHSSSISQATWVYIQNALDYYKQTKPAFIVLELNTPGGEVYAAQKISDALKDFDTQYDIPVICYINNWAISAGAMLAYSCRFITVTKDASMGAAEPVIMGEDNQMKTASEKINSALRTDFANRARFYDRNPWIAEAMVDKDIILVRRHGQIIKLNSDSELHQTGPDPDIVLSPKGKLLTLNSAELMEYGVADILLLPEKTSAITEAEKASGKWPASRMLLFTGPFFKKFTQGTVDAYQMDWKSRFLAFLSQPMISSLLLLGVILGFYVELSTPGFGFAGSIGLISLILIVLSSFALEVASWLELILLLVGIGILLAEFFVIPTFGILGVFGAICFFVGLMGLLIPGFTSVEYEIHSQTFNAAGQAVLERMAWFLGTIVASFGIILILTRYLSPYIAGYSRLVLKGNEQDASLGYVAGQDLSSVPKPGLTGDVLATLRPSGKVIIDGQIWDAVSQGAFIEKGVEVSVVGYDGSSVIVRAKSELGGKS